MGLTEDFVEALLKVGEGPIPADAAHETRRTLLNVLGTAISASATKEVNALVETVAGYSGGEIPVPGREEVLDRLSAASAIAFAAHLDDFDDTHLETVIHPGAATLGAVFPMSLVTNASGEQSLRAMALGIESQLRVGIAMSPSHYDIGWHITGTCGVIGAAVAAGVLLELDAEQMVAAVELAANFAVGHREAFGTPVKPLHAGKAASNGVLAALLAGKGAARAGGALDESGGYFAALSDEWSPVPLKPSDVESHWNLLDNTYKPFPCGIVAHPAIEAAINLYRRLGEHVTASVRSVRVDCNPLVLELMGRPTASTGLEARFCALHGVAVGLLFGRAGLAEFSDDVAVDPRVEEMRRRSSLQPDEQVGREAARLVVTLDDGTEAVEQVEAAAGSSAKPLNDEQLLEKFTALVDPILPGRSQAIADVALRLGDGTSVRDLAEALR